MPTNTATATAATGVGATNTVTPTETATPGGSATATPPPSSGGHTVHTATPTVDAEATAKAEQTATAVTEPSVEPTESLEEPPASGPLATANATIDASGGVVTAPTGENVTFPPGSVDGSIVVSLRVFDAADVPAPPPGAKVISHAIDLQPGGVTFDPPAVITFPYTDEQVNPADAGALAVWVYLNGAWHELGGTVNRDTHTVEISVSHFTMYVVMAGGGGAANALPDTGMGGDADGGPRTCLASLLIGLAGLYAVAEGLSRLLR